MSLGLYEAGLGDFSVLIFALSFYFPKIPNLLERLIVKKVLKGVEENTDRVRDFS